MTELHTHPNDTNFACWLWPLLGILCTQECKALKLGKCLDSIFDLAVIFSVKSFLHLPYPYAEDFTNQEYGAF